MSNDFKRHADSALHDDIAVFVWLYVIVQDEDDPIYERVVIRREEVYSGDLALFSGTRSFPR